MNISYDAEVNAAYIYLDGPDLESGSVEFSINEIADSRTPGEINLDFNKDGVLIGIEVLNASATLPAALLK